MPTEDHTSSDRSHQGVPQGGVELSLDELAKGLATGTLSRGKAIRWMGGALLGAALASVPGVALADDCRRLGRECRRDSQCCSGNCVRRGDDKVCACPEGRTRCNDRCVNLQTNERHCGRCFNRCAEGQECVGGGCEGGEPICDPPCPEGRRCTSGCDGCPTFCEPICPSCPEDCCMDLADGTGTACINCTVGCPVAPNADCSQCPTGTICVLVPFSEDAPVCCQPAA
jgi:hypothetical protein